MIATAKRTVRKHHRGTKPRASLRDDDERNAMVLANDGLVGMLAKPYLNRGVSKDDLIQEGRLGLMRAAELWEKTFAVQFSTYAAYWIKQYVARAVQNQRGPIRVPIYIETTAAKVRRLMEGKHLSMDGACRELGISKRLAAIVKDTLAIRRPVFDAAAVTPEQAAFDGNSERAREALAEAERILSLIPEQDADTLRRTYGIDGMERLDLPHGHWGARTRSAVTRTRKLLRSLNMEGI